MIAQGESSSFWPHAVMIMPFTCIASFRVEQISGNLEKCLVVEGLPALEFLTRPGRRCFSEHLIANVHCWLCQNHAKGANGIIDGRRAPIESLQIC